MSTTTLIIPSCHLMATTAIHQLGDISRDTPDLCVASEETETDYIGNWCSGLGFFGVRFPKATTRALTIEEELRYHLRLPENPPIVEMDDWGVVSTDDPYTAPELMIMRLHGIIKGHPRLADGEEATTSRITGKRNGLIATHNTLYRLGAVSADYAALYPNALERLLASLPEV